MISKSYCQAIVITLKTNVWKIESIGQNDLEMLNLRLTKNSTQYLKLASFKYRVSSSDSLLSWFETNPKPDLAD